MCSYNVLHINSYRISTYHLLLHEISFKWHYTFYTFLILFIDFFNIRVKFNKLLKIWKIYLLCIFFKNKCFFFTFSILIFHSVHYKTHKTTTFIIFLYRNNFL